MLFLYHYRPVTSTKRPGKTAINLPPTATGKRPRGDYTDAMKRICVYCGSSTGRNPAFTRAAQTLGRALVAADCHLIYGAGNVGLMGVVADTVLQQGGHVTGVIPRHLMDKEVGHHGLPDLRIVDSMHERKAMMAELADGFIALPGGFGTLEELFEILTWSQLGLHQKPVGLLNTAGYYDHLLKFLDHMVAEQLLKTKQRALLLTDTEPGGLLGQLQGWRVEQHPKWIDPRAVE